MPADTSHTDQRPQPERSYVADESFEAGGGLRLVGRRRHAPGNVVETPDDVHSLFVSAGAGRARVRKSGATGQGETVRLAAGELGLCPASAPSRWTWKTPARTAYVLLKSSLIRRVLERDLDLESRYVELVPKSQFEDPFVREAVRALLRAAIRKGGLRPLYADAMARALAVHLVCYHATASPRLPRYRGRLSAHRLRRVYDYVRAHLDRDLRMGDLAEQASLSEHHFCRMFSAATKETPFQMVRRLRMEEGARLLRVHPDWTVARAALEVGYRDPASFAQAFRRHLGVSPSDYRRAVQ